MNKFAYILPILLLAISCIKPASTSPRIDTADADYCLDFRGDEPVVRLVKKYKHFEPVLLNILEKPHFDCEYMYINSADFFYFFEKEPYYAYGGSNPFPSSPVVQIDFPEIGFIFLEEERKEEELLQFENKIIDAAIHEYFICRPYVDTTLIIKFRARITGECEQKKNNWSQPPWNIGAASEDSVVADLNPDGTLVIGGNGKMMDFYFGDNNRPWLKICNEENAKIIIDSGVTHIGDWAFKNCRGLTSITILNPTPLSIDLKKFYRVNRETCTLYVPKGSEDAYRKVDGWRYFENIKPIE